MPKTMETKHTKEYAEMLAEKYAEDENSCYNNDLNGFKNGYMKAIEETNVAELAEANKELLEVLKEFIVDESHNDLYGENYPTIVKMKSLIKKHSNA